MNLAERVLVPLLIFTFLASARCELITLSIAGVLSSGLGYYVYDRYKCAYQECCTDEYILSDLDSECEPMISSHEKGLGFVSSLNRIEETFSVR